MRPELRSRLATYLLTVCILLLFRQHALFARGPIGYALQGIAVVLMLWARLTFGLRSFHYAANPTEGGLVTHGPYHWWRHPIYAALLLFTWTGLLSAPLTAARISIAIAATLLTLVRVQAEERLLRAAFPGYDEYAARTKRFVPFLL